jgi:hypothetical protein
MAGPAFFRLPLNLPHAATLAVRIRYHLRGVASDLSERLVVLLEPYRDLDQNPPAEEARRAAEEAAALGRQLVDVIEQSRAGHDRLGQAIRNLFEVLERGAEGAEISLRAGENPASLLRPR